MFRTNTLISYHAHQSGSCHSMLTPIPKTDAPAEKTKSLIYKTQNFI